MSESIGAASAGRSEISLADEQGIGEIEAIPIVPAQVVALLFGREARRRDRREEYARLRHAGRLLRP